MKGTFKAPGGGGAGMSSVVRVPRAGGSVARNWVGIAQMATSVMGLQAGLQAANDQAAARKLMGMVLDVLHPFKIYQLPDVLRVTPDPENDWRKVRVRAGRVLETDATGTDGADANPDAETYPDVTDLVVPEATAKWWIWLEIGAAAGVTTAVVRYGTDPTASSYDDGVNAAWTSTAPWTVAEKPDSGHIPIGWVDTLTYADDRYAEPRQLLRTDVVTVGGGGSTECPAG